MDSQWVYDWCVCSAVVAFWWFGHSYGQTIPALLFRPVQYSESDMFGGDMLVFFSSGGDQGAASEMVGSAYEQERASGVCPVLVCSRCGRPSRSQPSIAVLRSDTES